MKPCASGPIRARVRGASPFWDDHHFCRECFFPIWVLFIHDIVLRLWYCLFIHCCTMPHIENPQLRFLSNAAELLTGHSPSTSAHLLAAHTQILHDDSKSLNVRQQKHHCGACGSIRQSKGSRITEVKPRGKSLASKSESTGGAKVYKCLRCHQRTVLPRKRPASKPPSRTPTATASPAPSTTLPKPTSAKASQQNPPSAAPEPQSSKAAENTNSKKRAKARKQGGLQALLASKQRTQPSLDLFDFLQ